MSQAGSARYRYQIHPLPLRVALLPARELPAVLRAGDVLAAVGFGAETRIDAHDTRRLSVALPALGENELVEVWRGSAPVSGGRQGRIVFREDGRLLYGSLLVDEPSTPDMATLVEQAYGEISGFLQTSRYPCPLRFWNYIPDINRIDGGLERYRGFCVGRYAALGRQPDFKALLPAASAVGTTSPGLLISFVSGKTRPLPVENPRQISAFHYPTLYSPRSPLFSRAICVNSGNGHLVFLSGTASIVGHRTRHPGDVVAQARETCHNIAAVFATIRNRLDRRARSGIMQTGLRVYLRHPGHFPAVHSVVEKYLATSEQVVYLKGDLCRSDLLLEIEGIFHLAGDFAA